MTRAEDLFGRIEAHGMDAINAMLRDAKSEEAFLDFKQSGDAGKGVRLCDSDAKNLSKALSGFANADGGVIVWGISAPSGPTGDVASGLQPLVDCKAFVARIDDKVSWGTTPPVMGVRSIAIPDETGKSGFVATLVPASAIGPHQSTVVERYLVRSGSSFHPVTHTVLAGMFGRRPQAAVFANYMVLNSVQLWTGGGVVIEISLSIQAVNTSAVVARDAYMSFMVRQLGSAKSVVNFESNDNAVWQKNAALSPRLTSFLIADGKRLAPFSHQAAVKARIALVMPFTEDLEVVLHTGCDGAAPGYDRWIVPLERLNSIVADHLPTLTERGTPQNIDQKVAIALLGLDDENRVNGDESKSRGQLQSGTVAKS